MGVYVEEVLITGDDAGLERTLRKSSAEVTRTAATWSSQLNKAGKSLDAFGQKAFSIGRNLSTYVTLPILAAGGASVYLAARFEFAMQKLVSLVGLSQKAVDRLKASVLALSRETGRGPFELANALYFITSAGLRGSKALAVLRASAKAAAVGLGDTAQIGSVLTSVMLAYAHTSLTAARAMDIVVRATKDGKMASTELGAALGPVLGVAAQAGISFDQLAAAIAAASRVGVPVTRMVTSLRFLFTNLLAPTKAAAANIDRVFGSVAKMQTQLATPGGLLRVLTQLKDHLTFPEFAKVTGGTRGLVGALTLVGKNADQVKGVFFDTARAAGSLNAAFDVASKTASFKFHQALASLETAGIELGNVLIPIIVRDVIPALEKAIHWFANLSDEQRKNILKWAGIAAAVGPVLMALGTLSRLGGGLFRMLGMLGGGMRLLAGGVGAVGGAAGGAEAGAAGLAGLLGPVGIAGAIALMGIEVARHGKDILGFLKGLTERTTPNTGQMGFWEREAKGFTMIAHALLSDATPMPEAVVVQMDHMRQTIPILMNELIGLLPHLGKHQRTIAEIALAYAAQALAMGDVKRAFDILNANVAASQSHYLPEKGPRGHRIRPTQHPITPSADFGVPGIGGGTPLATAVMRGTLSPADLGRAYDFLRTQIQAAMPQLDASHRMIAQQALDFANTKARAGDLAGGVRDLFRLEHQLPKDVRTTIELSGLDTAMKELAAYKNALGTVPSRHITMLMLGVSGPPHAMGGIIAGQSGFITRGPVLRGGHMFGEGAYHTPFGTGTEGVIPFDSRGIGILATALGMAMRKGGGGHSTHVLMDMRGSTILDLGDFEQYVEEIAVRALARAEYRRTAAH